MFAKYDVLNEAETVVSNQLEMIQATYEAKQVRMDARSRLMCGCPSCRGEQQSTLAWLGGFGPHEAKAD